MHAHIGRPKLENSAFRLIYRIKTLSREVVTRSVTTSKYSLMHILLIYLFFTPIRSLELPTSPFVDLLFAISFRLHHIHADLETPGESTNPPLLRILSTIESVTRFSTSQSIALRVTFSICFECRRMFKYLLIMLISLLLSRIQAIGGAEE